MLSQLNTVDFRKWHVLNCIVLYDTPYTQAHKTPCDVVLTSSMQYWPSVGWNMARGLQLVAERCFSFVQNWVPICRNVRIELLYYDELKESHVHHTWPPDHPGKIIWGCKMCINEFPVAFVCPARGPIAGGDEATGVQCELGFSGSQLLVHTRLSLLLLLLVTAKRPNLGTPSLLKS